MPNPFVFPIYTGILQRRDGPIVSLKPRTMGNNQTKPPKPLPRNPNPAGTKPEGCLFPSEQTPRCCCLPSLCSRKMPQDLFLCFLMNFSKTPNLVMLQSHTIIHLYIYIYLFSNIFYVCPEFNFVPKCPYGICTVILIVLILNSFKCIYAPLD